ncbi:hypothetical protein CLV37_11376 [Kineococcus rhizosphaerae]|uniref:Uncharacterized protein n=1 Tax=Kineococcus rhizosphaerae TaxID=559628 RepID=A0A2T0QYK2_9ACTN|nr:DUF6049 family protein [Kineococcus rhizosphaerae]PRY11453.1 hypothetical protein CLV37_11376 [Kineococcus rhizosphaerae]
MSSRLPVTRRGLLTGLAVGGVAAGVPASAQARSRPTAKTTGTATTGTATATTATALPLGVVLLDVTPTAYAAADPARSVVTVRARVRHRGTSALTGLTARLVAQRSPTVARTALDQWARASDRASITRSSASSDDVVVGSGGLSPGESADVLLTLPAASLGAGVGAHLAAVEVSDDSGRVGVARTFLVSAPQGDPTPLTLLLPLVAGRDGSPGGLARAVEDRLRALVAGSADPRVAWALDPALTAAVDSLRGGAQTAAATAGADADAATLTGWVAELTAAAAGRVVLGLPFGDPDLAALERTAVGSDLLGRAVRSAGGAFDALTGAVVRTDVAWPADEAADEDLLAFCVGGGATTVVLDDVCLPPSADLTFTPVGRASVDLRDTSVEALVADRTMSSVLADAADPDQVVLVRQRLIAEAATTASQRPSDPRGQLLVAPRSFAPAAEQLSALIADVESSGWASWQPLTDLLATPAPDVERSGPDVPAATARAALPTAHVVDVQEALVGVDDFATALPSGALGAGLLSQQRAALVLLGVSWRGHVAELPAARAGLARAVEALTAGVSVVTGSVRNLAAERSELPITVVNELDVPVQVDLVLRPRTARVQLDAVPRQTVAARSQSRVAVPVRALANGSVVVEAQLRTPAGSALGEPVEIRLNVRADVENWISGVVGGGAAGLLVLGLVRAFRKGRRRVDGAAHADVAPPPAPSEPAQAGDPAK